MIIPQGRYLPAIVAGDIVYTSGMTPRREGILILTGKVCISSPLETYKEAAEQAAANVLAAVKSAAGERKIARVLNVTVYIHAEEGFTAHSRLADFVSDYLFSELGENGIGARTAVGVASLPGDAPLEVQLTALLA